LFASPAEASKEKGLRIAFVYTLVTIFCALFGAVYEAFSHGVYAYGMLYAFAFPLLGGVLPAILFLRHGKTLPSETSQQLWHFGISAFTVGSLFSGALEIYGTSSGLTAMYWLAGGTCLLLSVLAALLLPMKENAVKNG